MKITKTILALLVVLSGLAMFQVGRAAELDSEEQKFVDLLNDYRKSLGRTELKVTKPLMNGAEFFAQDLADHPDNKDVNEHNDTTGNTPEQRGKKYGYYMLTENIGWGYDTAEGMFEGWKNSPNHKANMINEGARTIGISRVYKAGQTKDGNLTEWFWVADFSDEGVERLAGNGLKDSEMYSKDYKKMSFTVKKWSKKYKKYKKIRWAEVKVYDAANGRMIDHDITDKKGKSTVYVMGSGKKVNLKVASFKGKKTVKFTIKGKSTKSKKINWTKNLKYEVRIK